MKVFILLLHDLQSQGLIHPPKWLADNVHFLCYTGSTAYGMSGETSDLDVYGIAIPPLKMIFPHLDGVVPGFGNQGESFNSWSEHHINTPTTEYDFTVFSIVKFFHLAFENNPNCVDVLFVPQRCILHSTKIGQMIRDRRKDFLSSHVALKTKAYAFSQLKKLNAKQSSDNPKRQATIDAHGYDTKHGSHVVRLCLQAQQILLEGDLDLERNSEILKSVRRGEWSLERLQTWFAEKEMQLEKAYSETSLPRSPDEGTIKELLLNCLETHYGSLDKAVTRQTDIDKVLAEMRQVIERHGG